MALRPDRGKMVSLTDEVPIPASHVTSIVSGPSAGPTSTTSRSIAGRPLDNKAGLRTRGVPNSSRTRDSLKGAGAGDSRSGFAVREGSGVHIAGKR